MNTGEQEVVDQLDNAETLIEKLFHQHYNPTVKQRVVIGKIGADEITLIKSILNIDAAKYQYTIDKKEINHAFNKHGAGSVEVAARGQQPIDVNDFISIPSVLDSPDTLVYSGKNRKGLDALKYTKKLNGTTVIVMEIRTGKKELAFNTMYKK
jgi:hypothetical protein